MSKIHLLKEVPDGFGGLNADTKCGRLDVYNIYSLKKKPLKFTKNKKEITCKDCKK
jgi:hypothetical protein